MLPPSIFGVRLLEARKPVPAFFRQVRKEHFLPNLHPNLRVGEKMHLGLWHKHSECKGAELSGASDRMLCLAQRRAKRRATADGHRVG